MKNNDMFREDDSLAVGVIKMVKIVEKLVTA